MTLNDTINGPEWTLWLVFAIFAVLCVIFLSGHGSKLIAGYNTADKETQDKYDTKKLCRVMGAGISIIALFILIMAIGKDRLPSYFAYIFVIVTVIDSLIMIVLSNTICRK